MANLTNLSPKPIAIVFHPMTEGQGWYIVAVYDDLFPTQALDKTTSGGGDDIPSRDEHSQRVTLAELSSEIGLELAQEWAQQIAERFGLSGFIEQ